MLEDRTQSQNDGSRPPHKGWMSFVCLAMFTLFVLTLPRLGYAPLLRTWRWAGGELILDIMSLLGLIGGLVAAVYLPLRFRMIMMLPQAVKVAGLVGAGGLIVHLGFSLLNLVIVLLAT